MNFRPRHVRRVALWLVLLAVCCSPQVAVGQIKAFPQAEGAGASANGGRGGDVYHVTKLTDDGSVGTLRHGIESAGSAGRTIVFDVGGWIDINSKLGINNNKRNITIAGQTAPGGVGVRGNQFSVGGDDIIVRHMRFRPGKGAGRVDSAGANADAERVIYDHVSAGFSYDENFSVQATDVTLQYSTVSFGLEDHSAGSLLENPHRVSMHHNLYAHNNTRNPKHRVLETLDWVDNVIYNWDNRAFYMEGTSGSGFFWTANIDGNYFIAGPNQDNTKPLSGGSLDDYGTWWGVNAYDSDGDSVHDGQDYEQGSRGFSDVSSALTTWSDVPYPVEDEIWRTGSTQATYERVLEQFGATPWDRDEIDQLLRTNVESRTGGIISHENQLVAQGVSNNGFGMLGGGVAAPDADLDGMPDAWEEKHGTNPRRASNNNDFDQDGYTDLEEYLNDIAAFPAIGPLEFNGVGRYADWARWTNRWEPSRLDQVHISDGAAFVDAVGQKAGTLRVGHEVGGSGRLYVTSGWLEVTEDLVVGGEGTGKLDQYGGEVRVLNGGVEIAGGEYNLRGGRLVTPRLATQAVGEFAFTGGELVANQVDFDLEVTGGTLAAGGDAVGVTSIAGSLSIELGTLAVGIAGPADAGQIVVSGDALLSGNLVVTLLGGYAPTAGQSWEILTAGSVAGEFDSVTSGFDVQLEGGSLLLVATGGAGSAAAPEPTAMAVGCVAALALSLARRRLMAGLLAAVAVVTALPVTAMAVVVPVSADSQLSENGTTGAGDATDSGSGAAAALNARFNNDNRNEWLALKFDLSAYPVKARLENVALRTYMFRGNVNNTQTLHLYALAPGTAGEDWDEMTTTYGSMPGFTFDGDSTTNLVDVGGVVQDLGAYAVSGYEAEGGVSLINPASLTSLVKSMGTNDLLTLLVSYQTPANGQWRIMSREATTSDTGLLSGAAGDFAAFLSFDVGASGTLGDYNDDGVVNAADYTVWRDADSGGSLVNEEVSPGTVDIADYLYWRERYGAIDPGTPTIASSHAAPEPRACLLLVTIAAIAAALHRPAPRLACCNATGNRRVVATARR